MKIFIVTSLTESELNNTEINVLGTLKTFDEAVALMKSCAEDTVKYFKEVGFDEYDVIDYGDEIVVHTIDKSGDFSGKERVEFDIFEDEI